MTKAIILAAGAGSRLRPYTDDTPKGMVQVCGKPILEYQFEILKAAGIEEVVVVCGYQKDKIISQSLKIQKVENPCWHKTNMVRSLYCAKEWLDGDVIITYSDIIYEKSVLKRMLQHDEDIVISSDREFLRYWQLRLENPLDDIESFSTNEQGCITEIGQKINSLDLIQAQYIGLMRFKNSGLDVLNEILDEYSEKDEFDTMYMTDLLTHIIDKGVCLTPSYHSNSWLEIDSVDDLKLAEKALSGDLDVELIQGLKS